MALELAVPGSDGNLLVLFEVWLSAASAFLRRSGLGPVIGAVSSSQALALISVKSWSWLIPVSFSKEKK